VVARYPAALAQINAGTTIPTPAAERELAPIEIEGAGRVEADLGGAEAEEQAEAEEPGSGPGTPRRRR